MAAYTTIDKPSDYFNTVLYTGTQQAHNITGVGFAPNWVWIKKRSGADAHYIFDSVRGVDKQIQSNSSAAEYDYSGDTHRTLTAFGSDGFTLQTSEGVNHNNQTFASWNWKAGTSVSGNTSGSGTAKAYTGSVNTDAGFSIIRYLGNGTAGHTIPHHLGATPKIIFTKILNSASFPWWTYSEVIGNTHYLRLNGTNAADEANTIWNNTSPTSSVFSVGTNGGVNGNDNPIVAYCFADVKGYSKFGSYKGNGNADGTFIYTGFKPAFVMVKRTDSTNYWFMFDNKRNTSVGNPANKELYANDSSAEDTSARFDFLSNGFKNRLNSNGSNTSGGSYIYMAFAENPFTTSTGIPATAR